MHFIALALGYLLLGIIVLALLGMGVILVLDVIYKAKHRRRIADESRTEESLHHGLEISQYNSRSLGLMKSRLEFHYNSETDYLTRRTIHRILEAIFKKMNTKARSRSPRDLNSFLPLLFIPYVDGLAQFIGYCILIPFALALLVVGVFYAVLAIKEMRTNRLLKAERARVVQLHKELQLDKVGMSDLITTLLHLQETAKNTPSSDPSFLGLRDRIEATQNELARRPWGTR